MRLSKQGRQRFVSELRFAVEKMRKESDPFRKLYFFSATFGEANRLLNLEWDPRLCLTHLVLQTAYQAVNSRLQSLAGGAERGIDLPQTFFDSLTDITSTLAEAIEHGQDRGIPEILARLAELVYLTTGNGYYLYIKGVIRPKGL